MEIRTEKRIVEVYDTTYIAIDGKEFKSEGLCLEYENDLEDAKIRARVEKFELKELYGVYPLDTEAQYINDNHEYKWYRMENREDYVAFVEMYGDEVSEPEAYPKVVCVEQDEHYISDVWVYSLSNMRQNTIDFWKKHGFNVEFMEV